MFGYTASQLHQFLPPVGRQWPLSENGQPINGRNDTGRSRPPRIQSCMFRASQTASIEGTVLK